MIAAGISSIRAFAHAVAAEFCRPGCHVKKRQEKWGWDTDADVGFGFDRLGHMGLCRASPCARYDLDLRLTRIEGVTERWRWLGWPVEGHSPMGNKSRETIYGDSVGASAERAAEARNVAADDGD